MASRRRIDQALVVQTAIGLADTGGLDSVTLAAVADALGIRIPSLYNHVNGLPGLSYQMSLWAVRDMADRLRRAAVGKAGADALFSLSTAYRAFAGAHPGVYRLTLRAATPDEPELAAAGQEVIDILLAALRPYNLSADDMLHTIRGLRSILHGFVDLEVVGGFGMPLDRDESFQRLMRSFIVGIQTTSVPVQP